MEDRLKLLESNVNKLKSEYDQFFLGVLKTPPEKLASDVAREIRLLSTATVTNTALKFRIQQVVSRYNTYLQYWQRNLRDLEEGRVPRRRLASQVSEAPGPEAIEISSTETDREGMEALFRALVREYRKCGVAAPDISKVRNMVREQTNALKDKYGCDKVAYRVLSEEGRVKIKATPVGGKEG